MTWLHYICDITSTTIEWFPRRGFGSYGIEIGCIYCCSLPDFPPMRDGFDLSGTHCVYGSTEANTCVNLANLIGIYSRSFPYDPLLVFIMLSIPGQLMKIPEYAEFSESLQHQNGSEAVKRQDLLFLHQHREKLRQWVISSRIKRPPYRD